MSDRDVLKRAAEALRETSEPSPEDLARLRQRMLAPNNVTPLRKPHARKLRWILPLAAAFVAGSALAATPGGLQTLLELANRYLKVEWLAPAHEASHKPDAKGTAKRAPVQKPVATPQVAEEPAVAPAPVVDEPQPAAVPSVEAPVASVPAVKRKVRTPSTTPAPEERAAATQPHTPSLDLTLYKTAHDLHFRQRDYGAALRAWDEYLAKLPDGSLAIEARYNRALCLLRVGRFSDARLALAPFAEGAQTGGYRQQEAQRLLTALEKKPEPKP